MVWTVKLVGTVVKSLPALIKLVPERQRKDITARLNDHNPFSSLGARDDLLRVLRISWIESALEVDRTVLSACKTPEADGQAAPVNTFSGILQTRLKELRAIAFDRRIPLLASPIDHHFERVVLNAPATLIGKEVESDDPLTRAFRNIVAEIVSCEPSDIPDLYSQTAEAGVVIPGGTARMTFGDLVYLTFVETIQTPNKYPQAEKAFQIAVSSLGIDLGRECLKALEGLDERIDIILEMLGDMPSADGLQSWVRDIDAILTQRLKIAVDLLQELGSKVDNGFSDANENFAQIKGGLAHLLKLVMAHHSDSGSPASDKAILALVKRRYPDIVRDPSQAYKKLDYDLSLIEKMNSTADAAQCRDQLVNETMAGVRESIETGELEQGASTIEQALASLDQQEADARESIKRQRTELLEASITQYTLLQNPRRVADEVLKLISLDHPEAPFLSLAFMNRLEDYFRKGEMLGLNFPLEVAVELSCIWADQAVDSQNGSGVLLWLGKSLVVLGERVPHDELLRQAEVVYQNALASSDSISATYAHALIGLGGVRLALGIRDSRQDLLLQAVDCFTLPLQFFSDAGDVVTVAIVKSNLGAALRLAGERESGVTRLHEAVDCLQEAVFEPAFTRMKHEWARAQNNLGNALRVLGEREHNLSLLQQSVQAFRAALAERTQDSPLNWGITQNDLANALLALGEHTENLEFFHQAAEAYHAALSHVQREHIPLEWANTQHNLSHVYFQLAVRDGSSEWLEKALEAALAALEERTRQRVPLDWARTQNILANVLLELGSREEDSVLILQAVDAYEDSLEERTRERVPLDWGMTKHNLGNALCALADFDASLGSLHSSIEAYQGALLERTLERDAVAWGRTTAWLGHAFFTLGQRGGDVRHIELALENYRKAMPYLSTTLKAKVQKKLSIGETILAEHRS
ncbi:tetratricopeptide repeat protein [Pseudomonas syringae]|uniref:tetratricopeptide repeat protein n=1 Tax=Pseudomonas syringae TaxID=317 RepID=UPI001604B963|nr:tetratricopeptide repeat protein [Pseudomonas syringae]